jgi:hypothetical protein
MVLEVGKLGLGENHCLRFELSTPEPCVNKLFTPNKIDHHFKVLDRRIIIKVHPRAINEKNQVIPWLTS